MRHRCVILACPVVCFFAMDEYSARGLRRLSDVEIIPQNSWQKGCSLRKLYVLFGLAIHKNLCPAVFEMEKWVEIIKDVLY
jgi:hypothetical protein